MNWSGEILEGRINKQLDPDGSKLRSVLEMHAACERMRSARFMLVHLLAFLGVFVWVVAISPDWLPREIRLFAFVLWGSFLSLTIWVAIEEYVLSRKLAGHLTRKGEASTQKFEDSF